jgi:tRNA threonylcarbamoyladenosine biosynthesis protein TsaE
MEFIRTSASAAETAMIGHVIGRVLRQGRGDVLLLDGPLGAGKTTLVRSVAAGMGLDRAHVSSPTFVLIHEYEAAAGAGPSLVHVDAYRLESEDELDTLGWDRVLHRVDAGEAVLIIEWAERLGSQALRERRPARIRIEHAPSPEPLLDDTGDGARELVFSVPESWITRAGFSELAARKATTCPVTGQPVAADSPTYPFASERARLADLYQWFSGSYQISRPLEQRDLEEGVD